MSAADHDDEPIIAPGLAALFRRHPERVRKTAAGMIVAGVALFLVASVALPAGADSRNKKPAPAVAAPTVAPNVELNPALPNLQPAANTVLPSKPKHARKKAPATKAVISGLAANGIPNVALNAYRVAAARLTHAEPGCGIDWALLAGIGREESDHGRFAGATLNADGTSTPRIIGIPLNGNGTALIRDTDHGRIDGDTVYDRAAGPMQFIPSTWAIYGSDASGDGKADIFNINDAALSSARYLCAAGGDLRTRAGQVAAVLAYNHSDQYLAQVLALAAAYRTGVPVRGIPVGNITGGLPPVHDTGTAPPVNPGPPTAVDTSLAKQKAAAGQTAAAPVPAKAPQPTSGSTPTRSPGGGGSGGGAGGGTGGGPTGTTPPPTTPPTAQPTPTPTPTKVCLVPDLLNPGKCAIYGS